MIVDPRQIQLDTKQQEVLAQLAAKLGKPWPVVLSEALATYRGEIPPTGNGETLPGSFLDAARHRGLIGCLHGGSADLSTNPMHMEGFGK